MALNRNDINDIAALARLNIDNAKADEYTENLSNILTFVEQMQTVDTTGIEPLAHPLDPLQRLRTDSITETDQRERFQAIAPLTENGLYLVPKVIE